MRTYSMANALTIQWWNNILYFKSWILFNLLYTIVDTNTRIWIVLGSANTRVPSILPLICKYIIVSTVIFRFSIGNKANQMLYHNSHIGKISEQGVPRNFINHKFWGCKEMWGGGEWWWGCCSSWTLMRMSMHVAISGCKYFKRRALNQ